MEAISQTIFSNAFFLNENASIAIKISLKFVPKGPINNIPVLVQIMAWRRPGDKPLSEPMMVSLLTHICVTRPQWVKMRYFNANFIELCTTYHPRDKLDDDHADDPPPGGADEQWWDEDATGHHEAVRPGRQ